MDYIDKNHFDFVFRFVQLNFGNRVKVIWYLEHFKFTEEQLEQLAPYFNDDEWRKVSSYQLQLSNNFIRSHADHLHWMIISFHYIFDINFIREMKDKLDWRPICGHNYKIDSKFIREFYNYIDWHFIARFQLFDWKFVKEWKEELRAYLIQILENDKLENRKEYVDYLNNYE